MNYCLKCKNLSKSFFSLTKETKVISSLSFYIEEGENVVLLGPSGCGKSTLLNIISSLDKDYEGEINLPFEVGYMFQNDALLPWKNILSNVLIGNEIKKTKNKESIIKAKKLLEKYHLLEFESYYPDELSGGQRQRISLIRTLLSSPKLLLLDEPFSRLDYQNRLECQNDIYKILKEEKISSLIVTHDIEEAISLADKIIILSSRPCTKRKEIILPFKDKTPLERRNDPRFLSYFNEIYPLLTKN